MTLKVKSGYALLLTVIAINVFTIFLLMARTMWEAEISRELEEELIFRARQYVTAIEMYKTKNSNLFPQDLEILFSDKFLRKLYPDPMTESGEWNLVMQGTTGGKKSLLIVPQDQLGKYLSQAQIIGVASTSTREGYREYRKKKRYCEWAFFIGEDPTKDMPDLNFVAEGGSEGKDGGKDGPEKNSTGESRENSDGREASDSRTGGDEGGDGQGRIDD